MPELQHDAYFYSPQGSNPNYPLLIFLPGLDETAKESMSLQTAGLEAGFDVRCFIISPEDLDNFNLLAESILALVEAELVQTPDCALKDTAPRQEVSPLGHKGSGRHRPIYLCGESFGGCLALKVLEQAPKLFEKVVLINSASSFHRVPWLNLGSRLFSLTPDIFYDYSAYLTLPFLVHLNRVTAQARQLLVDTIKSAPKQTAQQRLIMMREFTIDETKLKQITQPVLLIGSQEDRILPSVEEAEYLAKIFSQATVVTLPHSGHACLVEKDTNLYQIMEANGFISKH